MSLSLVLHRKLRAYFGKRSDVMLAYVFGSTVKAASARRRPPRDLDIAVYLKKWPHDPTRRLRLRVSIAHALETLAKRPIDLALLNRAASPLNFQVLKYGTLIYESAPRAHQLYRVRTFNEHYDLEPLRNFHMQRLERRLGVC